MSDQDFDESVPEQSEQLDQLQPEDTLIDRGVDDVLDEGYIAPDDWSQAQKEGNTAAEQAEGTGIDQWLKQEEPDPATAPNDEGDQAEDWESESLDDNEVGRERSGRLVDSPTEDGQDVESELYGEDVGFAGGAASAEEAAVHIIDDGPRDD